MKKLHLSSDAVMCGVCGGIAEYLGIDPTIVRVLWALAILRALWTLELFGAGVGSLAYLTLAIIMPND